MFLQLFSKKVSFIHHEPYYYLPKTPIKKTYEQTDMSISNGKNTDRKAVR